MLLGVNATFGMFSEPQKPGTLWRALSLLQLALGKKSLAIMQPITSNP